MMNSKAGILAKIAEMDDLGALEYIRISTGHRGRFIYPTLVCTGVRFALGLAPMGKVLVPVGVNHAQSH